MRLPSLLGSLQYSGQLFSGLISLDFSPLKSRGKGRKKAITLLQTRSVYSFCEKNPPLDEQRTRFESLVNVRRNRSWREQGARESIAVTLTGPLLLLLPFEMQKDWGIHLGLLQPPQRVPRSSLCCEVQVWPLAPGITPSALDWLAGVQLGNR